MASLKRILWLPSHEKYIGPFLEEFLKQLIEIFADFLEKLLIKPPK